MNNIQRAEVVALADRYSIKSDWALAVTSVESADTFFWTYSGRSVPPIRQEAHWFYKRLPANKRAAAVAAKLAHKSANKLPVPNSAHDRYELLKRWRAVDDTAALEAISMGVGQVMGFHWQRLGFSSVQEMWKRAQTREGQIDLMLRYILTDKRIMKAIADEDVNTFSFLYNGKNYKKWGYHRKFAKALAAVRKHSNPGPIAVIDEYVRLEALGYTGGDAVYRFQKDRGIVADGIVGRITREHIALAEAEAKAKKVKQNTAAGVGGGVVVTGVTYAEEVVNTVEQVSEPVKELVSSPIWTTLTTPPTLYFLLAVALGIAAFFLIRYLMGKRK
ncbi:N-acetylmuramidase domain-containing protein [Pannonibacter sp. SL95]|uniref:N-acetylmuramidase domain-containing protein n=1 Tax=Pannonibacter sp. SL95 TaxID=2995153 RepID=UPI00227333F1|nr:N-acetylmuramidase domain-containing protein [Pannonibacter sp. SL95]MCY1708380.1 N-acetylmuramidase domain-containing protein [Pannonibacter sp. SL95]